MMDDILRDFPHGFETERLTIRCPLPGDGPEMQAALGESWPELKEWMPFAVGQTPTVEETEANLREAYVRFLARKDLRLSLFLKGSDTLVSRATSSNGPAPQLHWPGSMIAPPIILAHIPLQPSW